MKLTNTHVSDDCKRKCHVYVDLNGHYVLVRFDFEYGVGWDIKRRKRLTFKKIESLNRAVDKWIK